MDRLSGGYGVSNWPTNSKRPGKRLCGLGKRR